MKLKELIDSNNWLSISMTLTSLYPDQKEGLEAYEKVFGTLQRMSPTDSDIEIVLSLCYEDETNEVSYVDVSGRKKNSKDSQLTESLALEFVPWTQWLSMTISSETSKHFNELEIISHCLYEMTFVGYDEEKIQRQFSLIQATVDDYKNMTVEERQTNSKPLDDFLQELNDE